MGNEKRIIGSVEVREVDGKPEIKMFVPYESWSEVMTTWDGQFREKIQRGFFEGVDKQDVRALWNHDDSLVLGRTMNGTLRFQDGEQGMTIFATPPDTQAARDALAQIKGRYVTGTSFSFRAKEDQWNYDTDPMERTLIKGETLEFSPVTFPAYPESSAATRAAYDAALEVRSKRQAETDESESSDGGQADAVEADKQALDLARMKLKLAEAE